MLGASGKIMKWFKKSQKKPRDLSAINLFKSYPETLALALVRPALLDWVQGKIHREPPPNLHPQPNSYYTPYGLYKYDSTEKLNLISIPCVNETGAVIRARIREIYLAHILATQTPGLSPDNTSFDNAILQDAFFNTIVKGKEVMILAGVEVVDSPRLLYATVQDAIAAMESSQQNASSDQILAIRDIDSSLYSPIGVSNPLQTATGEYYFPYWAITIDSKTIENMRHLESIVAYCHGNNLSVLPSPEREHWSASFLQPMLNQIRAKISENRE